MPRQAHRWYAAHVRALLSVLFVTLMAISVGGNSAASEPAASPVPKGSRQLLVVRTAAWWAASGTLQRYERAQGASWRPLGPAVPVNVGRSGMGWGRGLHAEDAAGPRKREGDGRAPAGVFRLSQAFGAADALPADSRRFPYLKSLPTSYCVEDVRSQYYNQIVDSTRVKPSLWEQWSALLRPDGLFKWGVVVEQNTPEIKKAAGSCVFLHIWRGPRQPTAGCTSMSEQTLQEIIPWLDAKLDPVLVQLPDPVLATLREEWGLP